MVARSRRLDAIPPYLFGEIARLKADAIAAGRDLIDLGIGDPDQPTPSGIVDALARATHDPETHRYDESPAGDPSFLGAVARRFERRFGVTLDPCAQVLELIGSKEGLAHLAWAFLDAGDVSLVPDPAYTVYRVNSLMANAEVVAMPLRAEAGFLASLSDIPTDAARRAKLLWLNYPNNPTGAVATRAFFEDAVRFCRDHDILLVNDAAYAEVTFDGYVCPSVLQIPGALDLAVEFHSFSKMFNMTGWRIGMAVGAADALAVLNKLKSNVDSKQFRAVAQAAAYAADHADNDASLDLIKLRRDILVEGLNGLGWNIPKPRATFYVWLPTPAGQPSMTYAAALLEKAGVLAIPGIGYGPNGDAYVRMSLTVSGDKRGERVAEAVHRIGAADLGPT
jgi:LL-diaminopimelate aminotransferase